MITKIPCRRLFNHCIDFALVKVNAIHVIKGVYRKNKFIANFSYIKVEIAWSNPSKTEIEIR